MFAFIDEMLFLSFVRKHQVVLCRRPLQHCWKANAEQGQYLGEVWALIYLA